MTLTTSSYRLWRPDHGIPVRVSVGPPGWFPDPLVEWPRVYPSWALVQGKLDRDIFRRRYRHQLHRQTPAVLRELQDLQEGYDAPLVLLCHCSRGWCHRRFLSEWLEAHLGEEIPDLGA